MRILLISTDSLIVLTVFSTLLLHTTGIWSPWSDWSVCPKSCQKGEQIRVRVCLNSSCEVPETQHRECGQSCDGENQLVFQWGTWVVGGFSSKPEKWPWQFLIITELDGKWQHCGGTLITDSWVLSAAHCFLDPFGNNWNIQRITLGTINRNGIGKGAVNYTKASIVHVHEDFHNRVYLNDISLIKLPTPANANTNGHIQPATLPVHNETVLAGTSCVVTGWGATASNGSKGHGITLQYGNGLFRHALHRSFQNRALLRQHCTVVTDNNNH
ncbi:chymotrypsin-like elastase family member 2A isoform X2 [Styela clava]